MLAFAGKTKNYQKLWQCLCICGNVHTVQASNLSSGNIRSCGCLAVESRKSSATIHGESIKGQKTPEYRAWGSIIDRCCNPNHASFHNYGGRGITVCQRWKSYSNFLEDILNTIGRRPSNLYSLDRIDNSLGYELGNVRWATKKEQGNNRRGNVKVTYNGEAYTLKQWAEKLKINPGTVYWRYKQGWKLDKVFKQKKKGEE